MKRVYKIISVILVMVLVLGTLSGCTHVNEPKEITSRTVTDMAGRTVELPDKINSYITLWVGAVTITLMLDHGEHMVGCSKTAASYPLFERACQSSGSLTYFTDDTISPESILETGADVVFYRGADHAELAEKLSEAGVAAVDVEFNTYEELLTATNIIADVLNTEFSTERSAAYREYTLEKIEAAKQIASDVQDKKTVIVIRDTANLRAYGVNRFAGIWATICGGEYALKEGDPNGYVNLTNEQLMEYNPDFIFFIIPGEAEKFINDPRWSSLSAVINKQVLENPNLIGSWSNHGAEFVLQFEWAIETIYPEMAEFDLLENIKEFYAKFFDMELTDEEICALIDIGC